MSSIIGNDDTNKQWTLFTVVLYSKKNIKIYEVQDYKSNSGKNFNYRSNRFYIRKLAGSERLISKIKTISTAWIMS